MIERVPLPDQDDMKRIVDEFKIPILILKQNPKLLQNHYLDKENKPKKGLLGCRNGFL